MAAAAYENTSGRGVGAKTVAAASAASTSGLGDYAKAAVVAVSASTSGRGASAKSASASTSGRGASAKTAAAAASASTIAEGAHAKTAGVAAASASIRRSGETIQRLWRQQPLQGSTKGTVREERDKKMQGEVPAETRVAQQQNNKTHDLIEMSLITSE